MFTGVNYSKTEVAKLKKFSKQTITEDINIETENNIKKILSVSAVSKIDTYEILMGEISYFGKIFVNVVYVNEEDQIMCTESVESFNSKLINEQIQPNLKVKVKSAVNEVKVQNVSNNIIKLNVEVDVLFKCVEIEELQYFDYADNVYVKTESTPTTSLALEKEELFNEFIEFNIDKPIDTILSKKSNAIIKKVSIDGNTATIEGCVCGEILYKNPENEAVVITKCENFIKDIDFDDLSSSKLQFEVEVDNDKLLTEINELDNKTTLVLTVPIKLEIEKFDTKLINTVKDAFCTSNLINTTTQSVNMVECLKSEEFEEKIEGNATADDENNFINNIVGLEMLNIKITNNFVEDENIHIEGILTLSLLYKNEENEIGSMQIDIPFAISNKTELTSESLLKTNVLVSDYDAIVKHGKEIFIDAKIKAYVQALSEVNSAIITDLSEGDAVKEKDCAIEIYFAQSGESFWDAAKYLFVSEEILKQQNPDIIEPFEENIKLVCYNKK